MMTEKLNIIKVGGNILEDEGSFNAFVEEFAQIQGKKILVHGGGKRSTSLASALGVETKMVDGRRITDPANLEIVVMVYAGWLNKTLVSKLQSYGVQSLGLSGADLNMILAKRREHPSIDFGEVGDIDKNAINVKMVKNLLDSSITPVFCAVTHNGKGDLLNTNADTIAACLASALADHYEVHLTYCFEHRGVLSDSEDPGSVLSELTQSGYNGLVKSGAISRGMLPKLDNAFSVLKDDVKSVTIKSARNFLSEKGTILKLN